MKCMTTLIMSLAVIFLAPVSGFGQHQYVGVKKCGGACHRIKAKGDQYGQWMSTRHAKAFETLKSEKSLAKAKELGIADPSTDAKCVKCHVAAFDADPKLVSKTYAHADGVGCEACHGPGSDYMKLSIMQDREKSIAAGLVIPDKTLCVKCHNPENPFHKEFVFETFWPKIQHPRPKK